MVIFHPTKKKGVITSNYYRSSGAFHGAIDLSAGFGAPVYAAHDGVAYFYAKNCPEIGHYCSTCGYGFGNGVRIESSEIETKYGHLRKNIISNGQRVKAGDLIGYEGSSGCSTGSHLHFEMYLKGARINPLPYLQNATIDKTRVSPKLAYKTNLSVLTPLIIIGIGIVIKKMKK